MTYPEAYAQLNPQQKQAVDQIDGPVLVIAGPGTGKTQLLTTRIAHILATTDALPSNILCLTFTDAAAVTMRRRLQSMIGQAAYDVTISTYHAFGSDLLQRYPQYFAEVAELVPADALKIDQLLRAVQADLPYKNPFKASFYLPDLKTLISDYRRALLTPDDVRAIAKENEIFIKSATNVAQKELAGVIKMTKGALPAFESLLEASGSLPDGELKNLWQSELADALADGSTKPVTAWKDKWLAKDGSGQWCAAGQDAARRQQYAADIYELYLKQLQKAGCYDYDDMILRAIRGLSENDELRYTLQERYQYLLLDEFQDTNAAQLRLVELLTDNPVHEGRPNVLAVGDDDQAIYAFQGADYSHMLQFTNMYQDVLLVPLTQNYRSRAEVLSLSQQISGQIETRLHHNFSGISKDLAAAATGLPAATITAAQFTSDVSQYAWVAQQVKQLQQQGTPLKEIAVLAPKHQFLEGLLPFLAQQDLPVQYEKRENILDDPAIEQLLTMAQLTLALADDIAAGTKSADYLWPQVLGLPMWQLPTQLIWETSWQKDDQSWAQRLKDQPAVQFFMELALLVGREPLETMLDYLAGIIPLPSGQKSPFYTHYFGDQPLSAEDRVPFWQLLSNLSVLRQKLRDYRPLATAPLTLSDLLDFAEQHRAADIKIMSSNPYQEADDAVQLMTAFKSKGQEFGAVFLLAVNDEVWGSRARSQQSRISLPPNLQHIRYAGASQDERLRLLYVALTRAKHDLYLCSYDQSFSGRPQSPLKYLSGLELDTIQPDTQPPELETMSLYWHDQHLQNLRQDPKLQDLLKDRLQRYQLSATGLNRFISTADGPASFLMRDLLRLPSGSSLAGTYGDVIHASLQWLAGQPQLPTVAQLLTKADQILALKPLSKQDHDQLQERAHNALSAYLQQRGAEFNPTDVAEHDFRPEGVVVEGAHLSGKIDRLIIDKAAKTITVVDYKTGKPAARWSADLKMQAYRRQLYFYKLLVEGSQTYRGYSVTNAYLDYVEPDENGQLHRLEVTFDQAELDGLKQLIGAVWQHIQACDFPDIQHYSEDLKGSQKFQADLLDNSAA